MSPRVLILGAGFGGLELSTMLSRETIMAIDPEARRVPALVREKEHFGSSRRSRWFGR